jgi:hypothetical protein
MSFNKVEASKSFCKKTSFQHPKTSKGITVLDMIQVYNVRTLMHVGEICVSKSKNLNTRLWEHYR